MIMAQVTREGAVQQEGAVPWTKVLRQSPAAIPSLWKWTKVLCQSPAAIPSLWKCQLKLKLKLKWSWMMMN